MPSFMPVALALLLSAEASPPSQPCTGAVSRPGLTACALSRSLELRRAREELEVIAARRVTAGVWLPGHPALALTAAQRRATGGGDAALNWSATVSQELAIGGQRGLRLDQLDAEAAAQLRRIAVLEQAISAEALGAWAELLAAKAEQGLAEEVGRLAAVLVAAAEARLKEQLISPVDADLSRAEAVRVGVAGFEAQRRAAAARGGLAALLGDEAQIAGSLEEVAPEPAPADGELQRALERRGEIGVAAAEQELLGRQLALARRERVPHLTLSAFVQRDGFAERVLGGGASIPIPTPLGPDRAGEIAELGARQRQAATSLEAVRRRVTVEVGRARESLRVANAALQLFPEGLTQRAGQHLTALSEEMGKGRLSVREATLTQRSFLELRQAHLAARLAAVLARIELARATGIDLTAEGR